MSFSDLRPELAVSLDQLVPDENVPQRWADVLERVGVPRRGRVRRRRAALGAVAVGLLLAGAAAAMYEILHRGSSRQPTPGALTITVGGYNGNWPVKIIEIGSDGRYRVLWRCPTGVGCGEPKGIDWAPDGRHVAFTLAAFNGSGDYLGLHILDVKTGRDVHPIVGCQPASVAWSPNGKTLAYDCAAWSTETSRIHLIEANGTNDRLLTIAGSGATSPSWAPDGTRLAFSRNDAIYVARLDTSSVRLLTRSGATPDWSPDGRLIAYRAPSGVRLITVNGRPVRDAVGRLSFGPAGAPAWSPDGRKLAISDAGGLYTIDAAGRNLQRVPVRRTLGSVAPRPAWYPSGREPTAPRNPTCQDC